MTYHVCICLNIHRYFNLRISSSKFLLKKEKEKKELFMFNLHKELYYLFTHKNNFII